MTRLGIVFAALALLALAAPVCAQAQQDVLRSSEQDNAAPIRTSAADPALPLRVERTNTALYPDYAVSHSPAPMQQQANAPVAAPAQQDNATAELNRQQAMQVRVGTSAVAVKAASGPPQPLPGPSQQTTPLPPAPAAAPAVAVQRQPETVIVRASAAPQSSVYRLGTGDKVRVTVFGEDDLSGEFQVDGSGFIAMPLIGQVQAAGLSTNELGSAIATGLREGYLNQPRVSVAVSAYRPFYIIGQVNKPGEYAYVNDMTALNAVAMAGGYTDSANESTIYVRANGEVKEREFAANQMTRIHPGDVVRVPESLFWSTFKVFTPVASVLGLSYAYGIVH